LNAISSSQWVAFTRKSQSLYHFSCSQHAYVF
jgi:hypothetical protein